MSTALQQRRFGGILNAFTLKLIMMLLMLLDHIRYVYGLVPDDLQTIFVIVSRCAAPVFAFFVVEGLRHTRDARRYCLRLWVGAIIMLAGNAILNAVLQNLAGGIVPQSEMHYLRSSNNILLTFAASASAVALINYGREQQGSRRFGFFALAILGILVGLWAEWGFVVVPFILATYYLQKKPLQKWLCYAGIEALALLVPFGEPLWVLGLPVIALYNGQRGPSNAFAKHMFYVFYPAHLWIIFLVNFFILTGIYAA